MKYIFRIMLLTCLYAQQLQTAAQLSLFSTKNNSFQDAQTAATNGDFSLIFPLLFQNIITASNINTPDSRNATLLYWAVYYNNLIIVKALLSNGASSNVLTKQYTNNTSPLDIALQIKNDDVVLSLVGAQLLENREKFTQLIDDTSASADENLINTFKHSSQSIQALFNNLLNIFACDNPNNQKDLVVAEVTTAEGNPPATYTTASIGSDLQILLLQITTKNSTTDLGVTQLKIYMQGLHYYVEAYDLNNNLIGLTNIAESNLSNKIDFFDRNNQFLFKLDLTNLDTIVENIIEQNSIPLAAITLPETLCTITTQNGYPITVTNSATPFNAIHIYSLNETIFADRYLNNKRVEFEGFEPGSLAISVNGSSETFDNFIKNYFTKTVAHFTNTFGINETRTIFKKNNNFPQNIYLIPTPPLCTIKTQSGGPITILGSTTPFDEINYFPATIITLLNGESVTVDNFDTGNVTIYGLDKSTQTLASFIKANKFSGTFTMAPTPPIFAIKTQSGAPITILGSATPFDEIKYCTLNDSQILLPYNNGIFIDVDNFNKANITVVNTKTSTNKNLEDFIAANNFSETYYIIPTSPLFDIKSKNGNPLTILGASGAFDEIKAMESDEAITITTYLKGNIVKIDNLNNDNVAVIDSNNNIQSLSDFIAANNFSGSYFLDAIAPLFILKTQTSEPIKIPGTTQQCDEIRYIGTNEGGTVYMYLKGNAVNINNSNPLDITIADENNNTQSLKNFIQSKNYAGTHYIATTPSLFDIKAEKGTKIRILGSIALFDEIKYSMINGKPAPYTYLNGAPVTVDNFDPNNVLVTNHDGAQQTLTKFLTTGNFKGSCTFSAAPPIFDAKSTTGPLQILNSTKTFDEIKYFSVKGTPTVVQYINEAPTIVDNFDPNNVIITDQNGTAQTLTKFIQAAKFKGTFTISAALPLFDIKSSSGPIRIVGSNTLFDEIKYFLLNGTPTITTYRNGAPLTVDHFNPSNVYITGETNATTQALSDFINGNNYKGNFSLTTAKK
jgi:hypothetical protein